MLRIILEKVDWIQFYSCTESDTMTVDDMFTACRRIVEVVNRHMTNSTLPVILRKSVRLMPQSHGRPISVVQPISKEGEP